MTETTDPRDRYYGIVELDDADQMDRLAEAIGEANAVLGTAARLTAAWFEMVMNTFDLASL